MNWANWKKEWMHLNKDFFAILSMQHNNNWVWTENYLLCFLLNLTNASFKIHNDGPNHGTHKVDHSSRDCKDLHNNVDVYPNPSSL